MANKKIVLVTGASSGIGNACASYLGKKGFKVYGSSRNPARYEKKADDFFELIAIDVNDEASIQQAVQAILSKEGRIDVLVNNAGIGYGGAIEDASIDEFRTQIETNLLGYFRMIKAVLPSMRRQASGLIINISSIAGRIGVPFQGLYSASKHAIEGLTESLRIELRHFGIQACLVEPGDYATGFTSSRLMQKASGEASPYYDFCERAMSVAVHDETHGKKPSAVAALVHKLCLKRRLRVRYSVGPFVERLALFVKRILPSKAFEWIFVKYYNQ